jgi:hypothetical protein
VLVLAATAALGTTIYKWVDEKGITHYSQKPPPDAKTPRRTIETPAAPPSGRARPESPSKSLQQEEAEFQRRNQAREAELDKELREKQRARDGADFQKSLPVPGQSAANLGLQWKMLIALFTMESALDAECFSHKVIGTEAVEMNRERRTAIERWTIDRCGKPVRYRLVFQCPDINVQALTERCSGAVSPE